MPRTEMPAGAGRMVQIDHDNVSPTRAAGRDARGVPREEVKPTLAKHEPFVDLDGNVCDVSLRTSRMLGNTSEDERYEDVTRRDQITLGALPLTECPLTTEYAKIVNPSRDPDLCDSLIDNPGRQPACPGLHPKGCLHMQTIIADRRGRAAEAHKAQAAMNQMVPVAAIEQMAHSFGQGFGQSMQGQQGNARGNRANMAAGKGEGDK